MKEALLDCLADGAWHPAPEIEASTGITPREIRQLAEENGHLIIGQSRGYKLVAAATAEELDRAYRSLLSRAEKLSARARTLAAAAGFRAA
jgi:hypothetical protein